MSGKKKYFIINFIHLIHKVCQILSTCTSLCKCLHVHSQCLLSSTHTPNIPIHFTAIPQHIIISSIHCTGYSSLPITSHSHFWWDVLPCCYEPHWLNSTLLFFGLYTYLNLWRFTIFSTNRVKIFVSCLCSEYFDFMVLFMIYNLWIDPCLL